MTFDICRPGMRYYKLLNKSMLSISICHTCVIHMDIWRGSTANNLHVCTRFVSGYYMYVQVMSHLIVEHRKFVF